MEFINNAILARWYPQCNKSVHTRAMSKLKGGDYDISSIKVMVCAAKVDHSQRLVVLRCPCFSAPKKGEVKRRIYTMYLCFHEATGVIQGFPYSTCSCDQKDPCSHLLGFLVLCRQVQRSTEGEDFFKQVYPMSSRVLRSIPIPMELLTTYDKSSPPSSVPCRSGK